jgi:hypothetical protein
VLPWAALQNHDAAGAAISPSKAESYAARLDDLRFVWTQIQALNDSGPLAGQLDLNRLGVVGGAAALGFCGQVDGCQAAVNLNDNPVTPGEDLPWWGDDIESLGTIPAVLVLYEETVLPSHMPDRLPEIVNLYASPDEALSFARQYFGQPVALFRYLEATSQRNVWLRLKATTQSYFSDDSIWSPWLIPRLDPAIGELLPAEHGRGTVRDFALLFLDSELAKETQDFGLIQQGIDLLPEVDTINSEDMDRLEAALAAYEVAPS